MLLSSMMARFLFTRLTVNSYSSLTGWSRSCQTSMSTSIYRAFGSKSSMIALSNTICPSPALVSFQKRKSLRSSTIKSMTWYALIWKETKFYFRMKAAETWVTTFTSFLTHARHWRARLAPRTVSLTLKWNHWWTSLSSRQKLGPNSSQRRATLQIITKPDLNSIRSLSSFPEASLCLITLQ